MKQDTAFAATDKGIATILDGANERRKWRDSVYIESIERINASTKLVHHWYGTNIVTQNLPIEVKSSGSRRALVIMNHHAAHNLTKKLQVRKL